MDSPLFASFAAANVNGMILMRGQGNEFVGGRPTEDDRLNTVYIVDSSTLPFYPVRVRCDMPLCGQPVLHGPFFQAELYHQFHNGIGAAFPKEYTHDLKRVAAKQGRIGETGCLEAFLF